MSRGNLLTHSITASQENAYDAKLPQKSEQSRLFNALCQALADGGLPNINGKKEALRKRLERARKYLMLVALMGTWVLDHVPDVSVTRVDKVSFKALEHFARTVVGQGAGGDTVTGSISGITALSPPVRENVSPQTRLRSVAPARPASASVQPQAKRSSVELVPQ